MEKGSPFSLAYVLTAIKQSQPREYLSASAVTGCPRAFVLKLKIDYAIDLQDMMAAVRGTGFHKLMETAIEDEPSRTGEEEVRRSLEIEVDGEPYVLEMRGTPDSVDIGRGVVEDFKTTGYIRKDFEGYDSHKVQLSIYGWMLRTKYPNVSEGVLYYTSDKQAKPVRFQLLSDDEVERLLRREAVDFVRFFLDPAYLPPIPAEEEKLRFCATCPVREACAFFDEIGVTHLGVPSKDPGRDMP